MRYLPFATALAAAVCLLQAAQAQHSDIEFGYEGGELVIEGGPIFEGDFGDFAGGPDATDEPGLENAEDEGLTIGALELLGYRATRPLLYHDGTGFTSTSAVLTVENVIGTDVEVSESQLGGLGFIGQADGAGDLHTHVDFSITPSAPIGAYGLYLSLETFDDQMAPSGIPASEEFLIVFNRGLDETTFEDVAVPAFATTIPEPATMTILAMTGIALTMRRRNR